MTVDNALLTAELGAYRIYSSIRYAPPLAPDEWGEGFAAAIARRLRSNDGADKGRVLYVTVDREPVAALAYHVPDDGPLQVLRADTVLWVEQDAPTFAAHLVATLFDCLLEVSSHELLGRGRSILAWATDDDDIASCAFERWSFVGQPRGIRPAGVKARHYLLRRF